MKMKPYIAAALALSVITAPAMAAPYDSRPTQFSQHENSGRDWKDTQTQKAQTKKTQTYKRQYSYNGRKYDAIRGPAWKAPKGYTNHRNFRRGEKLPSAYRQRANIVDYRLIHLPRPPSGYSWVRVSNSVFLVSNYSGSISQIVLNIFY